jgi:hypothetical protein
MILAVSPAGVAILLALPVVAFLLSIFFIPTVGSVVKGAGCGMDAILMAFAKWPVGILSEKKKGIECDLRPFIKSTILKNDSILICVLVVADATMFALNTFPFHPASTR